VKSLTLKPFMNKKSIWWLVGMAVLVVGFLVVAMLPIREPAKGLDEPSINVPSMENVPPDGALKLETE